MIAYNLKQNRKINEAIDEEELIGDSDKNNLDESIIQQIVDNLTYENNDRIGLVIVAEMLNKPGVSGTYQVVFFDEATNKIIYSKRVSGKAGGFGVRNYWARSVYEILKNWRY